MIIIRNLVIFFSVVSLSACANTPVPNGKLHPQHADFVSVPIETNVTEAQTESPLTVKIPVTNMQAVGGGLIGALVVTAINVSSTAVSAAKRADEKKEILDSIDEGDQAMYNWAGQSYSKSIKNAKWIRVKKLNKIVSDDKQEFEKAGKKMREGMDGKAYGVYASNYVIGEQFENLTQNFRFNIMSVEQESSKKVLYSVNLSDSFYPEESVDEGFENYKLWIKNDNALIKKAIRETTKNINKQLKAFLADPYMDVEEEAPSTEE